MHRTCRLATVGLALAAGCVLLARTAEAGQAKAKPSLDDVLKQLAAYQYGQSRAPLIAIEGSIRASYNQPEARKQIQKRLLALLTGKSTTDCKRFICRQFSVIGGAEVVPALTPFLTDPEMSHMARLALERIPDENAAKALRDALGKTKGKVLIGVVGSLGERRDAKSIDALGKILAGSDEAAACAAAMALGKIGTKPALAALRQAKPTPKVAPAILAAHVQCADRLLGEGDSAEAARIYEALYQPPMPKPIRIAAFRGLVAARKDKATPLIVQALTGDDAVMQAIATRFVRETRGTDATKAFVAVLGKLPDSAKALLLAALAERGDSAARPAAVEATKNKNDAVRIAAIRALGQLGDATTVALLADVAASARRPDNGEAAASLDRLPGKEVNAAIVAAIPKAAPKTRVVLIRTLAARRYAAAVAPLLKLAAQDADAAARTEALKALGFLAGDKDVPALVQLLLDAKTSRERQAAERSIQTLLGRNPDQAKRTAPLLAALPRAAVPAKCALLRLLGRLGGAPALAPVRGALESNDAAVCDAAVRALADWPDASTLPDLLALAKSAPKPTHKILALRGYVRLVGLPSKRPAAKTFGMYAEAMKIATRPEEKRLVLGGLAAVRHVAALKLAEQSLAEKALEQEAAAAIVKIAGAIGRAHRPEAKAALKKAIGVIKDKRRRGEAAKILRSLGK